MVELHRKFYLDRGVYIFKNYAKMGGAGGGGSLHTSIIVNNPFAVALLVNLVNIFVLIHHLVHILHFVHFIVELFTLLLSFLVIKLNKLMRKRKYGL